MIFSVQDGYLKTNDNHLIYRYSTNSSGMHVVKTNVRKTTWPLLIKTQHTSIKRRFVSIQVQFQAVRQNLWWRISQRDPPSRALCVCVCVCVLDFTDPLRKVWAVYLGPATAATRAALPVLTTVTCAVFLCFKKNGIAASALDCKCACRWWRMQFQTRAVWTL